MDAEQRRKAVAKENKIKQLNSPSSESKSRVPMAFTCLDTYVASNGICIF
jgi:hypothetical protein